MASWSPSDKRPDYVEKADATRTLVTGTTGHAAREGVVVNIKILNQTAGTITIYDDNTTVAAAGTLIATIVIPAGMTGPIDLGDWHLKFSSGLAIEHDAATRAGYHWIRGA